MGTVLLLVLSTIKGGRIRAGSGQNERRGRTYDETAKELLGLIISVIQSC